MRPDYLCHRHLDSKAVTVTDIEIYRQRSKKVVLGMSFKHSN